MEAAAPPPSQGRGCLTGCRHTPRLETAHPASVSSRCFLRLLTEELQKPFPALFAPQFGRDGLAAAGSVPPSLPTPRPSSETQLTLRGGQRGPVGYGTMCSLGCPPQRTGRARSLGEGDSEELAGLSGSWSQSQAGLSDRSQWYSLTASGKATLWGGASHLSSASLEQALEVFQERALATVGQSCKLSPRLSPSPSCKLSWRLPPGYPPGYFAVYPAGYPASHPGG